MPPSARLSIKAIYNRIRNEEGFRGSYGSVKDYARLIASDKNCIWEYAYDLLTSLEKKRAIDFLFLLSRVDPPVISRSRTERFFHDAGRVISIAPKPDRREQARQAAFEWMRRVLQKEVNSDALRWEIGDIPDFAAVLDRLYDGRLGKIVAIVAQHTTSTQSFIAADNWRADPDEAPAGAMTAVGLHALDLMIEFAGRVRDVQCITGVHSEGPADDATTVLMRFASGATGAIFCSVATATNFSFAAYGSKGLAEVRGASLQQFRFVPMSTQAPSGPVLAPPDETIEHADFNMLRAELVEFARSIRDKRPYPISIDDVLHGMAVFDAAVESAKTGRIVEIA